jgi:hypothetical protein
MKNKKTPNAQRRTSNIELGKHFSEFGVGRWAMGVRRFL